MRDDDERLRRRERRSRASAIDLRAMPTTPVGVFTGLIDSRTLLGNDEHVGAVGGELFGQRRASTDRSSASCSNAALSTARPDARASNSR